MHSQPIEQKKSRPRKDDQQNALTTYRTKEIKAKKPAEMHSHPIEQKKTRPRKDAQQNAPTSYRTK